MTTYCCGQTVSTKFCPECGRKLINFYPLVGLLVFCRAQQKKRENDAIKNIDEANDKRKILDAQLVEKWKGRADSLAGMIEHYELDSTQ